MSRYLPAQAAELLSNSMSLTLASTANFKVYIQMVFVNKFIQLDEAAKARSDESMRAFS